MTPSFHKIVGTETAEQFQPQDNNPSWNSCFWPPQGFPRLTEKHETPDKVSSMYRYSWFQTALASWNEKKVWAAIKTSLFAP